MTDFSYREYVADQRFLDEYNAYQGRYAQQMRESDKVLVGLVRKVVESRGPRSSGMSLLDIGCSTGNLLLHLKRMVPQLALTGSDLAESSLDACRRNPELEGIRFEKWDVLDMPDGQYDIVTINAVLYMMEEEQFETALKNVARVLKKGGTLLVFDFFHNYPHDLHIIEISASHPDGLRLRFRPISRANPALKAAGFGDPTYLPFTLPIDLPPSGGPDDLITYTVPAADGRKLPFRGTLFQPWCHLMVEKV